MPVKISQSILPEQKLIENMLEACKRNGEIFIPGEVPSSKNRFATVANTAKGKKFVYSQFTRNYIKATEWYYRIFAKDFLALVGKKEPPIQVTFRVRRRTKQRFDYLNIGQIVQDMMVKSGWIEDDNSNFLIPVFDPYIHDPELYGVSIIPDVR